MMDKLKKSEKCEAHSFKKSPFKGSREANLLRFVKNLATVLATVKRKAIDTQWLNSAKCGPDGTRTRDPMRDRHVF
jgi:hypothetical protein